MLHLTRQVGKRYGVLDDNTGVVEYVSIGHLRNAVLNKGLQIAGVASDMSELTPQTVRLPITKCNFADGKNVFLNAAFYNDDSTDEDEPSKFSIRVGRKNYNGIFAEDEGSGLNIMRFDCGVEVLLWSVDYCAIVGASVAKEPRYAVKVLHALGEGRERVMREIED